MTVDEFQSRITNHTNGSVTLSLPLIQQIPEKAMTVNMTKFNTVPTNMSDDMGNIVTEMVTRGTSAVFGEMELARDDMHVKGYLNDMHLLHMFSLKGSFMRVIPPYTVTREFKIVFSYHYYCLS